MLGLAVARRHPTVFGQFVPEPEFNWAGVLPHISDNIYIEFLRLNFKIKLEPNRKSFLPCERGFIAQVYIQPLARISRNI